MVTTQIVSFHSGDERLEAYFARPEGDGPFPGVVVIHEALGLNGNIKDIANCFADEGYAALAANLFANRNRAVCMARFMSGVFFNSLDHGGIHDLKAALGVLAEQPYVDRERLSAIGFCMGGGFAIAWACTDDRLRAIAPYYGTNPRLLSAVARFCPVVGSYPEKDFTARSARKLEAELERHNIAHDIKFYAGAHHSFYQRPGSDLRPGSLRRLLATDAGLLRRTPRLKVESRSKRLSATPQVNRSCENVYLANFAGANNGYIFTSVEAILRGMVGLKLAELGEKG